MAEAKLRAEWDRTSVLCCVIVNSNPYRKKGAAPAKPSDFNPYHKAAASKYSDIVFSVSMRELKDLMVNSGGKMKL